MSRIPFEPIAPTIDKQFRVSAKCVDENTRKVLQKGGFVYLTYAYDSAGARHSAQAIANLADEGAAQTARLVYPVKIDRVAPGDPRTDFNPIDETGLITVYLGVTGYEALVDESLILEGGSYDTIAAGDPLKIIKNADTLDSEINLQRPKLTKDTSSSLATTVAWAITGVIGGRIRIKWVA